MEITVETAAINVEIAEINTAIFPGEEKISFIVSHIADTFAYH